MQNHPSLSGKGASSLAVTDSGNLVESSHGAFGEGGEEEGIMPTASMLTGGRGTSFAATSPEPFKPSGGADMAIVGWLMGGDRASAKASESEIMEVVGSPAISARNEPKTD